MRHPIVEADLRVRGAAPVPDSPLGPPRSALHPALLPLREAPGRWRALSLFVACRLYGKHQSKALPCWLSVGPARPAGNRCAINAVVWKAEDEPTTWQVPPFNSPQWKPEYNPRTGVERHFGYLKTSNGVKFTARVRVRGIVKMSIVAVIAVATSNIKLRYNAAYGDGWRGPDY